MTPLRAKDIRAGAPITYKEVATWAWRRFSMTMFAALCAIGALLSILLLGPVLEVKVNPPVRAWQIVDAKRNDNSLEWYIIVNKRRDSCVSSITWVGRWGKEVALLRAVWPDGTPANGANVRVGVNEEAKYGPFRATVPRGWDGADDIAIDATVIYNCGTPWPLPSVPVEEAKTR